MGGIGHIEKQTSEALIALIDQNLKLLMKRKEKLIQELAEVQGDDTRMYVYTYVCMYVCMLCMNVCMCMYVNVYRTCPSHFYQT